MQVDQQEYLLKMRKEDTKISTFKSQLTKLGWWWGE